ncbi:hypothetical protein AMAG_09930 [Allomyces macrogynus ATCC 38327]|uniref:SAP domain-containing protein n=1 Tax=Allomyces macrogynus (strain ATCC 38327) TaxID=578462 RepID=A0A0L0SPZ0_ALLM3|nr:hypothetical protein AMAG_09930 [Allomyces macrogynus ATCC 38327]|eukprot:KNE64571.1 hypothetical protein AMAG_09930 [Allomyces macrogynus ATCC 38327]
MRLISPYHHVASLPPASMPATHATDTDPTALDFDTVAAMLASRPDAPAALYTTHNPHDPHQQPQSPTFRLEDAVYLSPVDHSKLPPAPWLAAITSAAAAAAAAGDNAGPAPPPAPPQDATASAYPLDPAGFAALLGQWSPQAVDVGDAPMATLDPMATFMTTTTTTTMATHDAPQVTASSLPDPASSAPMPLPMITEAVVATSPASTPLPTDLSPPAANASSSSPAPTASRRPSTTTDGSPVLSAVPRRLSVAAATDAPAALPLPPARRASSSEIEHHLDERLLHVDFNDVTVTELKDHLRQRGKPATGKKAVLVARIKAEIAAVLVKRAARAPAGSAKAESLAADAERAAEDAKRAEDQVGAAAVAGIKPPRPDPPQPLPQPLPQAQMAMPMQMQMHAAVQYAQQQQPQQYHFPGAPAPLPLVSAGTAILPAGVMPGSMSPGIPCMSPGLPTGATGMSPSLATAALPGSPGIPAPGIWSSAGGPAVSGLPSPRFQPYPLARPRTNSVQYAASPLIAPSPPAGRLRTNSISYASASVPTTLPQPPRNRSASVSTMVAGMSLDAAAAVAAAAAWNEHAAAAAAAARVGMLPEGMMYTMPAPAPPNAAVAAAGLATLGHALGAAVQQQQQEQQQQPVSTMAPGAPSMMGGYVPGPAPGTL